MKTGGSASEKHSSKYHTPVMLGEVLEHLDVKPNGIYVDTTLGGGGYAEAILERLEGGKLFAFDTDPAALAQSTARLQAEMTKGSLIIIDENFGKIEETLKANEVAAIDGIVYDLGVSSNQLDTSSIGLSYRVESRLDMRLDPRLEKTAYEIINNFEETKIKQIFREFGEEPRAGLFAKRIVETRSVHPIETTTELADLLSRGIREDKRSSILSRIFQALRIEVNDELGQLARSLEQAIRLLKPGGRMVVVSYHSLEDRIVKNAFQRASAPKSDPSSPDFMKSSIDFSRASLRLITRKPLLPTDEEIGRNPRARSAKLRAAEKI